MCQWARRAKKKDILGLADEVARRQLVNVLAVNGGVKKGSEGDIRVGSDY